MKKLILLLMLGILISSVSATEEGIFGSFCGRTAWGSYCSDSTPDFLWNYTAGCSTMNFTLWVYNVSGAGGISLLSYGANGSHANDTTSTITSNTSLVTGNSYYAYVNGSCAGNEVESVGIVINIDTSAVSIGRTAGVLTSLSPVNVTKNTSLVTFYCNASATNLDSVWVNGTSSTNIDMICSGGACSGSGTPITIGCGKTNGTCNYKILANNTAGLTQSLNASFIVDPDAPIAVIGLKVNSTDAVEQNNETLDWTVNFSDIHGIEYVMIGEERLDHKHIKDLLWTLENKTILEIFPDAVDNCTHYIFTATAYDYAGWSVNSTNSSIIVFPCIEYNSGDTSTLNITGVALADVLTLTYTGLATGNTTTQLLMPPILSNATDYFMCNYAASNVNRTEMDIGPHNSTDFLFCNVTIIRTPSESGTVVVQEDKSVSIKLPSTILPAAAGAVAILLLWGATEIVRRRRS